MTYKERVAMINPKNKKLSQRVQCDLLSVSRSSLYYTPLGESDFNLKLMKLIDEIHMEHPTFGVLRLQDELEEQGIRVNVKRIRRLKKLMRLPTIYPKRNLSKLGKAKYIHPYLLRNLEVVRANQVWCIDITYIPMKRGFLYLTAAIDVYSRFIVGWDLSNTLDKENQTELIERLFDQYGTPEIINSDQGSQYTCQGWISCLRKNDVKISMDGKGRAIDNIFIERFWRTIKYDYVYLNPAENGVVLYQGISRFIKKYNHRKHQGINRVKPSEMFAIKKENKLNSA